MKNLLQFITLLAVMYSATLKSQSQLWGANIGGGDGFGGIYSLPTGDSVFSYQRNFPGTGGVRPEHGKMIKATNGKMYTTIIGGGPSNQGVIIEYDPLTNLAVTKHEFVNGNGNVPRGSLIQASNGKLYSMSYFGGSNSAGTIYEYDLTTSTYSKKVDFPANWKPYGGLTEWNGNSGKLYGMVSGGGAGYGCIVEYNITTGVYTKKVDMGVATGVNPYGDLVQSGTMLYGLCLNGGTGGGTILQYDPATNTVTKKLEFATATGSLPYGSLYLATDGNMYGLTSAGGANNLGVIFKYTASTNTYTKLYDFTTASGNSPQGGVIQAANGKLYGMTKLGGTNNLGSIFEYDLTNNTFTKHVDLASTATLGGGPYGTLAAFNDESLFGLTYAGGVTSCGVLFEFNIKTNQYIYKRSLNHAHDGSSALGKMVYAGNGKIYGVVGFGAGNSAGAIYEIDPVTKVFTKKMDMLATTGSNPWSGFVEAPNHKLYGTTASGGATSGGVLYEYDYNTYTYTVKTSFPSGSSPFSTPTLAANGKFYGTTRQAGANSAGIIYEYDYVTSTFTKKFDMVSASGAQPMGSMVEVPNGKMYGLTVAGGANAAGVIYEYDYKTNTYTKKIDLSTALGSGAYSEFTLGKDGFLYAFTKAGGTNSLGTILKYDYVNNVATKLLDLTTALGGSSQNAFTLSKDGNLYGLTSVGGANNLGTIIRINSNGTVKKMVDFSAKSTNNPVYNFLLEVCPTPPKPDSIVGLVTVCDGGSYTYTTSPNNMATSYTWKLPSGWTGTSLTNSITTKAVTAGGVIEVTANGPCGPSMATTLTVTVSPAATVVNVIHASRCDSGTVVLGATATGGTIDWYDAATAGKLLGTGTSFTTPFITATATYYAEAKNNCGSSNRVAVTATVNNTPVISAVTTKPVCDSGKVTLTALTSAGMLVWYDSLTGGKALDTATSFTTPVLYKTTAYYVGAFNNGCSSARQLASATIQHLDLSVTQSGPVLTATLSGAAYQWIDCATHTPINGATAQTYTAAGNGEYAVIITQGACSDTSMCYKVITTGIQEENTNAVVIYPNPNNGAFIIKGSTEGTYEIISEIGQLIQRFELQNQNQFTAHINDLPAGIYIIRGIGKGGSMQQRMVVTK